MNKHLIKAKYVYVKKMYFDRSCEIIYKKNIVNLSAEYKHKSYLFSIYLPIL